MDFDPDGLGIMATYKHGSRQLSHENTHLTTPGIRWLGVRSHDVFGNELLDNDVGLLRLSHRDRKKAIKMLEMDLLEEAVGLELEWRRELQVMLMMNIKAEIELLSGRPGGLQGWLEENLMRNR